MKITRVETGWFYAAPAVLNSLRKQKGLFVFFKNAIKRKRF
jgi:hypothetical protein